MVTESPVESSTFVLVHGGRHGGWCWGRVADRLRAAGHRVLTPTLTGLGERRHLLAPDIGLPIHVDDVVGAIEYEDLHEVVLVAHSYGGMVVSGAMEQIAERVRYVVYVDAHMPHEGESIFDLIGEQRAAAMQALADDHGDGWFVPTGDPARYGVVDPEDAAWLSRRMTPQPIRSYQDKSGPTHRAWKSPGTFIQCVPSSLQPEELERARRHGNDHPQFHHRVLQAPHDAMVVAPQALTDLLLEAARHPAGVL